MTNDSLLPFDLPAVRRKKVTAAFDGGLISSDGGLVLLREGEHRLGLAELLAGCLRDRRVLLSQNMAIMVGLSEPTGWGIREAKGGKYGHSCGYS